MVTKRRHLSGDGFAAAAREVHGDTYDYSLVTYRNNRTPVTIVCSVHGAFEQTPSNHLKGRGCAKCARTALASKLRKSDATFIKQARALHGEKYDYSHVVYVGARNKVEINCPFHGSFLQVPFAHLRGAGCPKCGDTRASERLRWTTERFVGEARKKFGTRFNYADVEYVDAWTPVIIGCPVHGEFKQAPVTHLIAKHGCPKCAVHASHEKAKLSTEEFLSRAKAAHGDRYDYSDVRVVDSYSRVAIKCPIHGVFLQVAGNHLGGKGCRKCRDDSNAERQRQPVERFIARAREVHGEKFDYSLVDYSTARKRVKIVCPVHGVFEQTPDMHLKSGCRQCADDALPGAYSEKRLREDDVLGTAVGTLYYVRLIGEDEEFFKIGISKNNAAKRFAGHGTSYGYRIEVIKSRRLALVKAFDIEQRILNDFVVHHPYRPKRRSRTGRRFGGRTECFDTPLPDHLLRLIES